MHNLLLEQPYTKVYGPSELEKPSVLCLVRTIRWLMVRYRDVELAVAVEHPELKDWALNIITESVLTRWLTLSAGLKWVEKHGPDYARLCKTMHDGLQGHDKARKMYGRVYKWLSNTSEKLHADMLFCLDYCENVWDIRYYELIKVDGTHKMPGFRSPFVVRGYFDYERKLDQLSDYGWNGDARFARFTAHVESMQDREQAKVAGEQANRFFREASTLGAKHSKRWRRKLLFTALADDASIAVPLAKVILAARNALDEVARARARSDAIDEFATKSVCTVSQKRCV